MAIYRLNSSDGINIHIKEVSTRESLLKLTEDREPWVREMEEGTYNVAIQQKDSPYKYELTVFEAGNAMVRIIPQGLVPPIVNFKTGDVHRNKIVYIPEEAQFFPIIRSPENTQKDPLTVSLLELIFWLPR